MKTPRIPTPLLFFAFVVFGSAQVYTKTAFGQSWEHVSSAAPISGNAQFAAVHPFNQDTLFIGAGGNLYVSSDGGKNWKRSLDLGPKAKINRIYSDRNRIFLLTTNGLFESANQGKSWKQIFRGRSDSEENTLGLTHDPNDSNVLYLGTGGGLFLSRDQGRTWQKETNELAHQWIYDLDADPVNNELFIASDKGLYRAITRNNRLDRIYIARHGTLSNDVTTAENETEDEFDSEGSTEQNEINSIVVTYHPDTLVALGTNRGVWISEDEGNHWERLSLSGFKSVDILDLVYSPEQKSFFAATKEGVYFYEPFRKHWNELAGGLSSGHVRHLALISGGSEILYVATNRGLYKITIGPELLDPERPPVPSLKRWNLALELFQNEPAIGVIQKQVIRYANVSHWKTRRWQWASRLRALVPSLSIGQNFSKSETIDLDRGSTNEPDRYIIGPPDLNQSWDFDLQWDLSNLIWNTAQTSIDSREKLAAELRLDLLSEATRLYFERRRTQAEFILYRPTELMEQIQELLRIEELTANLDALTNGYLSAQLRQLYGEHPEYLELWKIET